MDLLTRRRRWHELGLHVLQSRVYACNHTRAVKLTINCQQMSTSFVRTHYERNKCYKTRQSLRDFSFSYLSSFLPSFLPHSNTALLKNRYADTIVQSPSKADSTIDVVIFFSAKIRVLEPKNNWETDDGLSVFASTYTFKRSKVVVFFRRILRNTITSKNPTIVSKITKKTCWLFIQRSWDLYVQQCRSSLFHVYTRLRTHVKLMFVL